MFLVRFLILASLFSSTAVLAGPFSISCSGADCTNSVVTDLILQIETDVNNDLPDADASTYLKGMANASVGAGKGTGTDYSNDIDLFIIGASLGVAADLGDSGFGDVIGGDIDGNQLRGIGIQPAIMGGINMGIFDWGGYFEDKWGISLDRLKIMFNILPSLEYDKTSGQGVTIKAETSNFGIHARYKYIEPYSIVPGRMLYWTGVDFTTGIERSYMKISTTKKETKTFTSNGATITATDATINAGAEVTTWSIPVEVSTGVQWLYAFTTYLGAGADLNFGEAKANTSLTAPVTISGGGITAATLTPSLDLGQTDKPTSLTPRIFFGQQIGVPLFKINVQMDYMLADSVWGLNAGVKFVW